jgi:Fe-S-cluster containining protein
MMTTVSVPEALLIGEALIKKKNWMSIARRLQKAAKKASDVSVGRGEYFRKRIPCPLLNRESGMCEVYDARPAACRYYYVVSDPSSCSIDKPGHEVKCVNLSEIEALVWKYCAEIEGKFPTIAPLPLMVIGSLRMVFEREGDNHKARSVSRLLPGIMSPEEWLKGMAEHAEERVAEDTGEAREAILAASKKVGLIP